MDSAANLVEGQYRIICQVYYLLQRLRLRSDCYDGKTIYANEWGIKREDFEKMASDFYDPDLRPGTTNKPLYGSRTPNSRKIYYAMGENPIKTPKAPDASKYTSKSATELREDTHLTRMQDKGYGMGPIVRSCDVSQARGTCEVALQLIKNEKGSNITNRDLYTPHTYQNFKQKEALLFGVGEILVDMSPETTQILKICRLVGKSASLSQAAAFLRILSWVHITVPMHYENLRIDVMPEYEGRYMNSFICMVGEIAIGMLEQRREQGDETFKQLWELYKCREQPAQRWMNHMLGAAIVAAQRIDLMQMLKEHGLESKPYALWAHDNKAIDFLNQIAVPRFMEKILLEQAARRALKLPKP